MPSKLRKRAIKACLIVCFLFAVPMAINWFMTYKLEDTLRKRLRQEVVKATDGFYDFSFDKLKVDLFSGELMIKGLSFHPDSTTLANYKGSDKLPNVYFDIHIDTIDFKGINLTWLFDYRKLTFDKFIVNHPQIKITSLRTNEVLPLDTITSQQSFYDEHIRPYFDIIQAKHIYLQRASVEYLVEDSLTSYYKLNDFRFTAHNFIIDQYSQDKEHLLFSDNFEFRTDKPQVIYDSDHFLLNISQIKLSTIDSIVHVGGVHLKPKDKYWATRFTETGVCIDTKVKDVILDGLAFSRKGSYNFIDAKSFSINHPNIEYFYVKNEGEEKKKKEEEDFQPPMWSLYSIVSPIFEQVSIKDINVESAKFQYSATKKQETDVYTLNKLNFLAHSFLLNSMSHQYNFFHYVKDFSLDAENITSYIPSRNGSVDVKRMYLSTYDKMLKISDAHITPLKTSVNDNYAKGNIKEIEITGLNYNEGLDADKINITSPRVDLYIGGKKVKQKKIKAPNKKGASNLLNVIAPYIAYVSVKDIKIKNGRATILNRQDQNQYRLDNLDFYAKNFYLDKETRRLRDYLFSWDEYSLKFKNFDNMTPDKRYRVQIEEGDFDSVSGDMLLRNLKVVPEKNITGSYISFVTPYARLLGLNEKEVRHRKISFKTFILESPVIEVVKDLDTKNIPKVEKDIHNAFLQLINFDLLTIPSPSLYYYDVEKQSSLQVQAIQVHVDSFRWELNQKLKLDNLIVESPFISIVGGKEKMTKEKNDQGLSIASFGDIDIRKLNIRKPILKIKKQNSYLDFSADNYLLTSLFWSQKTSSILSIEELDFSNPNVYYSEDGKTKKGSTQKDITQKDILKAISVYANETKLGRINISDLNARYSIRKSDGTRNENKLTDTHLLIENLNTNWDNRKLNVEEIAFRTKDINHPLMNNFYTLRIGDIDFSKRRGILDIRNIKLDPNHPKFDFAYLHPTGKDWFKVQVDSLQLSGIDISNLISDTVLLVKKMKVDYVLLENLKNQKIEIEHNIMPLLYQEFQRLPLRYLINDVDIRDFTVIYEELAKNGYTPSRIPFAHMNGQIKEFTNIQKSDNRFYTLHADGLAMGTAPFVAAWKIPVDSTNDKFYLTAEIRDMDMRDLNQLVRPMAPAYVQSGKIQKLSFQTEATSLGATVDMEFAYDSLYVVLLKRMDSDEKNKMLTRIVNRWGIEESNKGKHIRLPHDTIVRDPYHSNFNYFWQILQPPLIKSVGVTDEKQNILHNIGVIAKRIKNFFGGGKKEEKKK